MEDAHLRIHVHVYQDGLALSVMKVLATINES